LWRNIRTTPTSSSCEGRTKKWIIYLNIAPMWGVLKHRIWGGRNMIVIFSPTSTPSTRNFIKFNLKNYALVMHAHKHIKLCSTLCEGKIFCKKKQHENCWCCQSSAYQSFWSQQFVQIYLELNVSINVIWCLPYDFVMYRFVEL